MCRSGQIAQRILALVLTVLHFVLFRMSRFNYVDVVPKTRPAAILKLTELNFQK